MRHKHNLSHYRLLTGDLGQLLPCGVVEVLPGDAFNHSASVFVRLSPMAAPVMHRMRARIHHFFVPHRLSWPSTYATTWENFITGGPDGNESNPVPTINSTGVAGDLLDYLGIPTQANIEVSSLPLRAANLVYNEWFRDQDLIPERDLEATTVPLVSWGKDYLTTARPWPQKGTEVTLPLGTTAPVSYSATAGAILGATDIGTGQIKQLGAAATYVQATSDVGGAGLFADLSEATAARITDIRRAFALQRFAEVRARFGSRYSEYLRFLGVTPPDARLQRPEYLGGGTAAVSVSEVLQTAPDAGGTDPDVGVADMYGHGVAMTRASAYRKRFAEHGYVLSFLSVRPQAVYANGVERTFLRRDREDFWQRELEHIGQQAVLQQEVYATSANADDVFGYSDRYQEYRYAESKVAGEFRTTLDYWHLARLFGSAPALNQTFVECDPSKRIFNVESEDVLWCAVQHRLVARRLVSRSAGGRIL